MYEEKKYQKFVFGRRVKNEPLTFKDLIWPHLPRLGGGGLVLFISNLLSVFIPRLINKGVSYVEGQEKLFVDLYFLRSPFLSVLDIVLLILFLSLMVIIVRTLSRIILFNVGRMVEKSTRKKLYEHLILQDNYFYRKNLVGDLMNHLTIDTSNIRFTAGFIPLSILNLTFFVVLTVPVLVAINLKLALIALLPFPFMVLSTRMLSHKMLLATKQYQEKVSELMSHVQENLLLSQLVRLFHRQKHEVLRFKKSNDHCYEAALRFSTVRVFMYPVTRMVLGICVGLVLMFGLKYIREGAITLGDFVEFNSRIIQLAWPFMSLGFVISGYSRGKASLARINDILLSEPHIVDGRKNLNSLKKIDVVDLNLSKQKPPNLINLSIKEGQHIGIIGLSGSYKSSFLNALARRIKVNDGTIFFNECDINNLTLQSLYSLISYVPQEPFLFHATIEENICLGANNPTKAELEEAIEASCLSQDLKQLSQGLKTVVGERGITLSGGQKQRVCLARALIAKKPVLMLDDALSSVDIATEKKILKAIFSHKNNSIKIFVSSRPSVVSRADIIFIFDKGSIVHQGNHKKLLETSEIYQELLGVKS